ncbi:MAG: phage tail tape measure protein [Fusobacterium necrophorum]|nr:phage tail tape measure protein [Fusobacterium necrophorum]
MANEELLVTLGVQDKGLSTQIKAINKELKSLDTQYKLAEKGSKGFDDSLDGLNKKLTLLQQKYDATSAKLTAYNKKAQESRDGIEKKQKELEKLKNSEEDNSQAIAKAEKQLNNYRSQLKQAENGIKETEAQLELLTEEIESTNKAIDKFDANQMSKQLKEVGNNLQNAGDKFTTFGEKANSLGNSLIALSSPIVAFAGYATKAGIAFEDSMAKTGALAGATGKEFEKLSETAKQMGANIAGASATDVADSFGYLALAGYDVNQMLSAIEPNVKASIAWGTDMATNADLVTDSLSSLGLKAEDTTRYLDTLTQAQNNSNTSGQQLLEAYVGVGGMFRDFNTPLEESTALLGVLANRGIKGSEAGNALNSVLINLMGTTSTTEGALKKLGVSAYDSEGNFRGVETTLRDVAKAMENLTQEDEDLVAAQLGGKTQIDTLKALLAGLGNEYDSLKGKLYESNGALETMYETMSSTTAGKIETFKSTLEGLGLQLADHLLPHINNLIEKGMALVEWFGSLDEETQKAILSAGLFTAASGGALKIVGSLSSSIGATVKTFGKISTAMSESSIISTALANGLKGIVGLCGPIAAGVAVAGTAIYTYKEYQDALNTSLVTGAEDLSFLEKAFFNMNGAQVKTRKELEELGLVQKELNNNLSNEFKSAIESATKDTQDFNFALRELNFDNVVSQDEVNKISSRTNDLMDNIKNTIDTKGADVKNALQQIYMNDGQIDESEKVLLEYWDSRLGTEKSEAEKLNNEINRILNEAKGRELTSEEIASIENYYAQLKAIELRLQADNSYELEYAQNEFKERLKTLDAEGAQELLQQRYKQYEEERIQITARYDALISQVESKNGELTEQDKKLVADLRTQRDKMLQDNENYWNDSYNLAIEQNENLVGVINKYNGEILDKSNENYYNRMLGAELHYKELNDITESGYKILYNSTTGAYDDMYVKFDEHTKKVVGLYNVNKDEVAAMTDDIGKELQKEGRSWAMANNSVVVNSQSMSDAYIGFSNTIVGKGEKVIGTIDRVKDSTEKTQKAIKDLNGNPIAIGSNAEEIINKLQNTKNEVNSLDGKKATINIDDGGTIETFGSKLKNMWSSITNKGNFAIGTNNAPEGLHMINEKGWELVDAPSGKTAFGIATGFEGDTAYLPRGTRVRTNLASTEMMIQSVKDEVTKQLSSIDYNNTFYTPTPIVTNSRISSNTNNVEGLINNVATNLTNNFIKALSNVALNANVVSYLDGEQVANRLDMIQGKNIKLNGRWR